MTNSIKRLKASDGTGNASQATVTQIRSAGATTQHVDTVTGLYAGTEGFYATMGTPHTFTDPITGETITVISEASAVDFQGHIDTGNIIIDAIAPGYTDTGSKVGDIVVLRPTTQWANDLGDTLAVSHNDDGSMKASALFADPGVLTNGVITPSVASNNLTVAIKTLAGNDPSATDPVYVRIGNTVRTLTAALSVSLNAGTNWFGKGTAPLATLSTYFFAYLGYNATDGVVLGVATTPHALKYSDFSTTSTDWTYAKISNVAHAASTDVYEVVGRFNAILGISASYNWSLPAGNVAITQPTRHLPQYPCRFSVYRNAAKSITAATFTNINPDTKNFDLGNNVDIVTNVGRFTAPVTGLYYFTGLLYNNSGFGGGANHVMIATIYKNGSPALTGGGTAMWVQPVTTTVSGELLLIAGDYVELFGYCDVGPCTLSVGLSYSNLFTGFLINQI